MARYKVLKSVAHSLGHSFASTLNYDTDDYVMGHLLTRARDVREPTLLFDLIAGTAAPESLLVPAVRRAVKRYSEWLPDLVRRHFSDMRYVRAVRMTVSFDLNIQRSNRYAPTCTESPFVLRVEIEDDCGKVWPAEQRDWWFPEPPTPPRARPIRRAGLLARVGQWLWSALYGRPGQRSREAAA
jgi:hypothetical protein